MPDTNTIQDYLAALAGQKAAQMLLNEEGYAAYYSGSSKMNKFAQYFDDMASKGYSFYGWYVNGADWCDIAYDWAVCQAFGFSVGKRITYQSGGGSADCTYSAQCYQNNGAYIRRGAGMPRAGDQIFYYYKGDYQHTGMVYAADGAYVYTIEGNCGGGAGRVKRQTHSLSDGDIHGYGRPNYLDQEVLTSLFSSSSMNGELSILKGLEDAYKNPTLSEDILENKRNSVKQVIDKVNTYIEQYNNGKCSKQKLTWAQESYQRAITSFEKYLAQQKERNITNYDDLEEIYNTLTSAKFEEIDELNRVESLGTNEWFYQLNTSYNEIIDQFYVKLTNIIKNLENEVLSLSFDEISTEDIEKKVKTMLKSDYKDGEKIIFSPSVKRPETDSSVQTRYLWNKMFSLVPTIKTKLDDLNDYKDKFIEENGKMDYDVLCYEGLKLLLDFCNSQITISSEKLDNALQDKDFKEMVQQYLNLTQLSIFKLYGTIFGNLGREIEKTEQERESGDEEVEETVSYKYIKKGPSFNFGGTNTKYKEFCELAADTIFKDKLYLPTIDLTDILTDLAEMAKAKKILKDEEIAMNEANMRNEASYKKSLEKKRKQLMTGEEIVYVDWRELIYQMAQDYYNYAHNPLEQANYYEFLIKKNPNIMGLTKDELKKPGYEFNSYTTGYEVFYTDILGFWRQLYYNPLLEKSTYELENNVIGYSQTDYDSETAWYKMVSLDPSRLNFWFDLTEGSGELSNYSIYNVGDRLKALKDSNVRSLYYKDVPEIILYEQDDLKSVKQLENAGYNSYTYFQIGGPLLDAYNISSQGRSALDSLQEQLYKFAYCVENITITTLPVYTLKPNYRVMVQSHINGLSGEYIVSKYSIPLVYNGTMSITATKAVPYIGINK